MSLVPHNFQGAPAAFHLQICMSTLGGFPQASEGYTADWGMSSPWNNPPSVVQTLCPPRLPKSTTIGADLARHPVWAPSPHLTKLTLTAQFECLLLAEPKGTTQPFQTQAACDQEDAGAISKC